MESTPRGLSTGSHSGKVATENAVRIAAVTGNWNMTETRNIGLGEQFDVRDGRHAGTSKARRGTIN